MEAMMARQVLPTDSGARKSIPMATGLLDYFPAALAAVAEVSRAGNDKHNPGQPMHWARGKSTDHADTIIRHLVDRGLIDPEDGLRHSAKLAWRALALLQEELEATGVTPGRASKFADEDLRPARYGDLLRDFEYIEDARPGHHYERPIVNEREVRSDGE